MKGIDVRLPMWAENCETAEDWGPTIATTPLFTSSTAGERIQIDKEEPKQNQNASTKFSIK